MTHASPRRLNYFRDGCGCFCGYCGMPPLLFQVGAAYTCDLFGKRSIKNFQEVEAPTKASPFGRGGGAADGEGVTKGNRLLQKEYHPNRTSTEIPQHKKRALCQR